jgi:prophage tail gpP-like protein
MFEVFVKNATTGQRLLWRFIKVRKSLDEICHSLELEIPSSERLKVKRHHKLEVRCFNRLVNDSNGEHRVTTVLVDQITASADPGKHSVMVYARSPARDIIDSAWSDYEDPSFLDYDPTRTLEKIANDITFPFFEARGIEQFIWENREHVTRMPTNGPETGIVSRFTFESESPWTMLTNEADQQGLIFTSNEAGNLYLWKVKPDGHITRPFHITEGVNVKNIKWTENGSEQFHRYVVKGGGYEAVEIDDTCPGARVLTIELADQFVTEPEVERRAKTELRRRRETKTIATVPTWGLTDEQIISLGDTNGHEIYWVPNTLVPVKVPSLGLNADLLVSEVEYTASHEEMSCDITLVNRSMYE